MIGEPGAGRGPSSHGAPTPRAVPRHRLPLAARPADPRHHAASRHHPYARHPSPADDRPDGAPPLTLTSPTPGDRSVHPCGHRPPTSTGYAGMYVHFDGYPDSKLPLLLAAFRYRFAGDLEAMARHLIDEVHIGWEELGTDLLDGAPDALRRSLTGAMSSPAVSSPTCITPTAPRPSVN
ncbi:hypothetical protein NKH18_48305 [Streptomyces sp. M10(2022)]